MPTRGRDVLVRNPEVLNKRYLRQFPEFLQFLNTNSRQNESSSVLNSSQETPEEISEQAFLQLKNQVLAEILESLKASTPQFFEKIVVDTIVKMSYGGSHKDAGRAIGQSRDEDVDGVINEDRLGLDVIYLQAKRWQEKISRPEVQKFAGTLQGKRTKKGIFITTFDFSTEARDYVANIDAKIILISGQQLVEFMWEHNIGLSV